MQLCKINGRVTQIVLYQDIFILLASDNGSIFLLDINGQLEPQEICLYSFGTRFTIKQIDLYFYLIPEDISNCSMQPE